MLWLEVFKFFIYDSIKIILLLSVMIAVIGFFRTFLPAEKLKSWISRQGVLGNFFASLFGAITPFCSCSSIPIFISFLKAQVPLGVAFSFLITSPLVNEYLVVLMLGFFGWKVTVAYCISGMLLGIFCGIILGKMRLEKYIVNDLVDSGDAYVSVQAKTFLDRIKFALNESVSIVKKLFLWIMFGVGVGALIHNFVPQEAIQNIIKGMGVFSVPVAVILGVPLYGSCAAIVPIAVALFQKGIPLGTALSFMMAVAALSLPEAVMLRRAMRLQLIMIFFSITTLMLIFTGYLFNFLQNILVR